VKILEIGEIEFERTEMEEIKLILNNVLDNINELSLEEVTTYSESIRIFLTKYEIEYQKAEIQKKATSFAVFPSQIASKFYTSHFLL